MVANSDAILFPIVNPNPTYFDVKFFIYDRASVLSSADKISWIVNNPALLMPRPVSYTITLMNYSLIIPRDLILS